MNLNVTDNKIVLSKKASIPLVQGDKYTFSPADRTIYIVRGGNHFENGSAADTVVLGYNMKGELVGSYKYRDTRFEKFSQIKGYTHMVYAVTQKNGFTVFYQARLLPMGFCTDIIALHARNSEGKVVYFDELAKIEKSDKDEPAEMSVDEIIASVGSDNSASASGEGSAESGNET